MRQGPKYLRCLGCPQVCISRGWSWVHALQCGCRHLILEVQCLPLWSQVGVGRRVCVEMRPWSAQAPAPGPLASCLIRTWRLALQVGLRVPGSGSPPDSLVSSLCRWPGTPLRSAACAPDRRYFSLSSAWALQCFGSHRFSHLVAAQLAACPALRDQGFPLRRLVFPGRVSGAPPFLQGASGGHGVI